MAADPTPIAGAASTWRSISRHPTPSPTNVPALARRGINLVDRHHRLAERRAGHPRGGRRRRCRQSSSAPNFSAGVVLFEAIVGPRREACSPAQPDFGAFLHEAHHAAKKDAPSGTALLLKRSMEQAGFTRPSTCRRRAPGYHSRHPHGRVRRTRRIHHAHARGARSHRLRARRARRRPWVRASAAGLR